MAFNIRQWLDRISEHPNRRTLTNVEDPTDVKTYDLSRAEGEVSVQGTALTAANLNDLEGRIASAFTAVDNAMPEANPAETATGSLTKLKVGGIVYEVEGGGGTTIEKITKAQWDAMTAEEREAFIGVVVDTNGVYLPLTAENIPFDSNNSIAEKVNKLTVKLTLAEYNALTEKAPNTRYILTDAPALEYTSKDLSYDGGTETVWDKVEEVDEFISQLSNKYVIGGTKYASGITRVDFGVTFSSPPVVSVIPVNSTSPQTYLRSCALVTVTTTYFEFVEIAIQNNSATLINGTDNCMWLAVGNKA